MESKLFHTLCTNLNLSTSELMEFISNAPISYKVYSIPKKNGGRRTIAHPSKKLKKIQRELLVLLEKTLQIHQSAFAYIKGKNIINNAELHKNNKYLLKLDFYDFFNSISDVIFINYLDKIGLSLSELDSKLVSHIFFWNPNNKDKTHKKLILSVGSPSSPMISNAIMYFFDSEIKIHCDSMSIVYTRYADDLSISGNDKDKLKEITQFIRSRLYDLFNGKIILNDLKTILVSPGYNKFITGITLTPQGGLSIGRKRKKYIFGLIYKYIKNELKDDSISHIKGMLSFSYSIEPSFIRRLELKYGKDTIRRIINEK
ncbi:RNA-directed DNA polymerase [Aggregatibacter actinomycetemcomitans]|uniref:retron St85 family RNA-directed DNA polymerase n=1 Tax=Aggregatibacter actinomycetemcomitans TaxID=714 RepID=UPI00197B6D4B|nr:retron St85 family RNA-directed DNA polymerase [Aggregatibacter actinomycetemcomitans]MBN6075398.1 RNA-directed DNA polymerase [Aggregatibacter actinomycetemcomitans]